MGFPCCLTWVDRLLLDEEGQEAKARRFLLGDAQYCTRDTKTGEVSGQGWGNERISGYVITLNPLDSTL